MKLRDAVINRQSVRFYLNKNVEINKIKKIIEYATYVPLQDWKFIIIDDKVIKKRLVDMGAASFIEHVSLGIMVLYANDTNA